MEISVMINGLLKEANIAPNMTLLDFLREKMRLTGTKEGCGEAECGACTVLLNGTPVPSCVVLAVDANGKEILTVEGLEKDGELDKLQQAFLDHGAVQCGFCTPGMLMTSKALLMKNQQPTEEDIRLALSGNLCRCTGYKKIVEAVHDAAGCDICAL